MVTLVLGGAGSGKSQIAEDITLKMGGKTLYIATMEGKSAEAKKRIARHAALRAGKGFDTLEKEHDLHEASVGGYQTIILECLSNLLANEMFGQNTLDPAKHILAGFEKLKNKNLIIVSNNIFDDGFDYGDYQRFLGELNCSLAKMADNVIEVVAGIPICLKGKL